MLNMPPISLITIIATKQGIIARRKKKTRSNNRSA